MSKKITTLVVSGIVSLWPLAAMAVDFGFPPAQQLIDIPVLLNRILFIVWPIFIGFAIIMFIVAGFLFLKAQGDPAEIKTAQKALLWGVVGVIVGVLAFSIPLIIRTLLGF